MGQSDGAPSWANVLTNLDVPMPWPRKLYLLARNASLRVVRRSNCCGHPGQPGC